MELRIEPNHIINIPIYFTPKIQSGTKIKNLKIYVHGYRNQRGKPVKSKIKLEGTVSQSFQSVSQNSILDSRVIYGGPTLSPHLAHGLGIYGSPQPDFLAARTGPQPKNRTMGEKMVENSQKSTEKWSKTAKTNGPHWPAIHCDKNLAKYYKNSKRLANLAHGFGNQQGNSVNSIIKMEDTASQSFDAVSKNSTPL